jgi:hypothetical protein
MSIFTRRRLFSGSFVLALCILCVTFQTTACAQEMTALKIDGGITIDGSLDEPMWADAQDISTFTQFVPSYNAPASLNTSIKVMYDNRMLYFGFVCHDPQPDKISAKATKRDDYFQNDDAIVVLLDTFHDRNSVYWFGVNPLGTQQDGRLADNGRTDDSSWDGTWYSVSTITDSGWICEVGIPYETIRYDSTLKEWGWNIERRIARNRERSFIVGDLVSPDRVSQYPVLTGLDIPEVAVKRHTFIPYVQLQSTKGESTEQDYGADFRYSLSSELTVEATVNPDFATVEGDIEQVNLTRFELFYPEKRPFFLEGAENYSTRIQQFYSRRIGEVPWGVKLNGKLKSWKMNALTTMSDPSTAGEDIDSGTDAVYSAFRMNREYENGSNIGLIGANRHYDDTSSGSIGATATLFFTDVLGMTSQVIKSYGDETSGTWTGFIRPAYDSQFTHFHVRYTDVGEHVMENMNAVGFITDDDRREFDTNIQRHFWINAYGIDEIVPSINYNQYWSQEGRLRSWNDSNRLAVTFLKKWEYQLGYTENMLRYEKDFRNRQVSNSFAYDSKSGTRLSLGHSFGRNFDRDLDKLDGGIDIKVFTGLDVAYHIARYWFRPADPEDRNIIQYVRSTYYVNTDMYFKVFYQTKLQYERGIPETEFDLLRKTLQLLYVWRFYPPFGSLQLAYQEGSTRHTMTNNDERSLFCKFSWVF